MPTTIISLISVVIDNIVTETIEIIESTITIMFCSIALAGAGQDESMRIVLLYLKSSVPKLSHVPNLTF
jgi:hypothetical protein